MIAPSGLGIWIAYASANSPDGCVAVGAQWVAMRAGFNGWQNSLIALESYRAKGLRTYPWIYPTPAGIKSSIAGFVHLWDTGLCDGLIIDAEEEWRGPNAAQNALDADFFVQELRDRCPDAWIAHAPMDYIDSHPTFPWLQFGKLDAVMPQVYAFEHNDLGHAHHLEAVEAQWRSFELAHPGQPPRWPIGCTYRPKTRGYDAEKKPIWLEPWPDQCARVAADVAAFLDHPITRAASAPSLYTLEAAHPEVIAMLADRVRTREAPSTQPDTAPNDPYRVDRLESALDDETKETKD
jgi:hypothetical protein